MIKFTESMGLGCPITTGLVESVGDGTRDWRITLYRVDGSIARESAGLTERGALRVLNRWGKSMDWLLLPVPADAQCRIGTCPRGSAADD